MPWTAAAIVGAAAVGAAASNSAAKKGAGAANAATQLQYDQYYQNREDQAPWRNAGIGALRELTGGPLTLSPVKGADKTPQNFDAAAYLAANPDVAAAGVDPYKHYNQFGANEGRAFTFTPEAQAANSKAEETNNAQPGLSSEFTRDFTLADFQKDPGYDFRLNQGLDSVQGSRAARGSMLSGATLKALNDYGSDYASSEYGKAYDRFNNDRTQRFNRLATVAGIGQTATNNVGTQGANVAMNAGNNLMTGAGASAAGTVGTANAVSGGLSNLQSLYQLNQLNKTPGQSAASGSGGWGSSDYYGNQDMGQYL